MTGLQFALLSFLYQSKVLIFAFPGFSLFFASLQKAAFVLLLCPVLKTELSSHCQIAQRQTHIHTFLAHTPVTAFLFASSRCALVSSDTLIRPSLSNFFFLFIA
ncbi:UNVERIFIED_CONTAM: hypothetical protein K2H54_003604 [Gekko kuhli]